MALVRRIRINLDIVCSIARIPPEVAQNDMNSIIFEFNVTKHLEPFDLTGVTGRLAVQKPSGMTVYQNTEIIDGLIVAELRRQAYVEPGEHLAELELYKDGRVLHTLQFPFDSRKNIMSDAAVESTNDWAVIHEALQGFISREEADVIINQIVRDMVANNEIEFDFSSYLEDYLTEEEIKELLKPLEKHVEDKSIHHDREEIVEIINDTVQTIQGPPGADGSPGIDGTNGVDGKNGLSAFEIAVEQGFTGTEQEWLESLRGADGRDGIDGKDGQDGERGEQGPPGTTDFNELENVPSTLPPTAHNHNLNDVNWQTGAINGHVLWTGGNVGLNFGTTPDAAGIQECGIQARSSMTSMLLRGSGRLDSLNRAFFFRPNNANAPTPDDMILFNDGRLNARVYSQDGVLLDDLYMPITGNHIIENSLNNAALPTAYPMGFSQYTTNDNTLGFPHPSLTIRTFRYQNGRIEQFATTLTGTQRWRRTGSGSNWTGGGQAGWHPEPTMAMIEKLCEKLDIDINEITEV